MPSETPHGAGLTLVLALGGCTGRRPFLGILGALGAAATFVECDRAGSQESPSEPATAPLMAPAELNARLPEVQAGKIAVLHVGPEYLWNKSRIPGSRWVGEAGTVEGLASLEATLKALPVDTEVVAYCGCCPFSHCPTHRAGRSEGSQNIRPARRALAGRARATFLDLRTNLRTDWIGKGFSVEKA